MTSSQQMSRDALNAIWAGQNRRPYGVSPDFLEALPDEVNFRAMHGRTIGAPRVRSPYSGDTSGFYILDYNVPLVSCLMLA